MPSINFPTSPALNDEYSFEGKTWIYNGTAWVLKSSPTTVRLDAAFSKANDAYNLANTANINANIAISTANIAFNVANGLAANVQYAWNAANTANGNILTGDYKAVAKLSMDYGGSGEFYFPSHYSGQNPDIYVTSGESLAIKLFTGGNSFVIRYTANGDFYNIGLTHVSTNGTISLGGDAQGKTSGTLFIDAPLSQSGNSIVYHSGYANTDQRGNIVFGYPSAVFQENINETVQDIYDIANNAAAGADTWGRTHSNAAFNQANTANQNAASASSYANSAFSKANTANTLAQAAFDAANNATDTWVRNAANAASSYANSAFTKANNALANTSGTVFGGDLKIGSGGKLIVLPVGGDEGGEILLEKPPNGNLSGGITIDAYQDKIRIFEQGGTARGVYIDLTQAAGGVGTNLLNPAATPDSVARDTANSAYIHANAAYNTANAASSYANGAFLAANTADQKAVTSGTYANSAFGVANSASSYANGAFATANTKLPSTGGTISGDLTITGNLIVEGNNVIVNVSTLAVEDSLIQLARNNTTDAVDIGFLGHYNTGSGNIHTGLVRSASDDTYYLFDNYPIEPTTNTIDTSNAQFRIATLKANLTSTVVNIRGYDPIDHANNSYQVANSASSYANGAFAAANTADQRAVTSGDYANSAFSKANTANTLAQAAFDAANNATDTWVRNAANSASSYANSAYIHANSAFTKANLTPSYVKLSNTLTIIDGSTSNVWSGSFNSNLRDVWAGVYNQNNSTALFTFASGSSNVMSVQMDGSLFVGEGWTSDALGVLPSYGGWIVASSGIKSVYSISAGSDITAGGHLISGGYVQFGDGTKQYTANTDLWARNNSNSAYLHANAAFAAANSAVSGTIDVYARNHANAAFDKANTAPTPVSGIFDYGLVTEVSSYTAYDYGTL